ncbi:MAG: hypothetical protein HY698_20520 [Deltaproteobacteria bacterium]|nr:hypothetical protein [Deltaproteobacteria bacterium]
MHIVGTPLWCDARHARDACFVTSARVKEARRHRQIIATETTIQLLTQAGRRAGAELAVPLGRPFSLGNLRLELFPSGHVVGAASLAVDLPMARVVCAGTVNPNGEGFAGRAEIRRCDVLVIDASPFHQREPAPPRADVVRDLMDWVEKVRGAGETPVLLAEPLGAALDVMAALEGTPVRAPRLMVEQVRVLRQAGLGVPLPRRLNGPPRPGEVVIWPPSPLGAAGLARLRTSRLALVGTWAADPTFLAELRVDAGFPLLDQAGHADLVDYIVQTGAREVYLTGGGGELVRELESRAIQARLLGPPTQLSLWGNAS